MGGAAGSGEGAGAGCAATGSATGAGSTGAAGGVATGTGASTTGAATGSATGAAGAATGAAGSATGAATGSAGAGSAGAAWSAAAPCLVEDLAVDLAAPFLAGLTSSGCSGRVNPSFSARRRRRSACASMSVLEWLFTPTPIRSASSIISVFVMPSSFASSCTRMFFAKAGQPFVGTTGPGADSRTVDEFFMSASAASNEMNSWSR
jgi:hypothetical protein